ncbi:MAG TPA: methyltransferase domain-containing protein [Solirubrobacterales bacterium]|nr:methyltransferase domain-containing protein [Solirubrobacterales bacterium]
MGGTGGPLLSQQQGGSFRGPPVPPYGYRHRVAGQVDYEKHGVGYARRRLADPRIAERIAAALGDARTVLNVGAGAGSYEPRDRWVLAVEPSATMRAQRAPHAAPCLAGAAEALPFDDDSVDAAMACVTIHHWDRAAGLAELRRVARGPVVIFTFELAELIAWQRDYFAEAIALEQPRFGTVEEVAGELGGEVRIERMPTPADCTDGFFEAYWNRPEVLLDPTVRASQSIWGLLGPGVEERIFERLGADLASGRWDAEHPHLREMASYEGSLRLVVSEPD